MSQVGLPFEYRFAIKNETGISLSAGDVTIVRKAASLDANGALQFETSNTTVFSSTSGLADGGYDVGSSQSNASNLFLGADFLLAAFASGGASGNITAFIEVSPDGGTTYPTSSPGGARVAILPFTSTLASSTLRTGFEL